MSMYIESSGWMTIFNTFRSSQKKERLAHKFLSPFLSVVGKEDLRNLDWKKRKKKGSARKN
jgi:hypothetical protein